MPIRKSRIFYGERKTNNTRWDEAISDAKKRIRSLRYSIRVFEARKKAGEVWPDDSTTQTQSAPK